MRAVGYQTAGAVDAHNALENITLAKPTPIPRSAHQAQRLLGSIKSSVGMPLAL